MSSSIGHAGMVGGCDADVESSPCSVGSCTASCELQQHSGGGATSAEEECVNGM